MKFLDAIFKLFLLVACGFIYYACQQVKACKPVMKTEYRLVGERNGCQLFQVLANDGCSFNKEIFTNDCRGAVGWMELEGKSMVQKKVETIR